MSQSRSLFVALSVALVVFHGSFAQAQRPVRCNGIIQFRPCGQAFTYKQEVSRVSVIDSRLALYRPRTLAAVLQRATVSETTARTRDIDPLQYARITAQTFKQVSALEGQWSGIVEGNGKINLELHWYRQGTHQDTRPMGSVVLVRKATNFGFRSSLPPGAGWTWQLRAVASTPS